MPANYTSPKPDGYLRTRNNIYLERGSVQENRTYREAGASRDLPEQSRENYGKKEFPR